MVLLDGLPRQAAGHGERSELNKRAGHSGHEAPFRALRSGHVVACEA